MKENNVEVLFEFFRSFFYACFSKKKKNLPKRFFPKVLGQKKVVINISFSVDLFKEKKRRQGNRFFI